MVGFACLLYFWMTSAHYSELNEGPLVDPYIDSTHSVKELNPSQAKKLLVLEQVQIL